VKIETLKVERKVAVIFHRLGPYHFARLRAAGREMPVLAIETSGADETYAWDLIAGTDGFERVTLFKNADAQRQPKAEVATRMAAALDKIRPQVVVTPGWADAAALAALQWCGRNQVPAIVMSESTKGDESRKVWKEWVKRRVVGLFSAGLAGGTPHAEYLAQLGLANDQIFLGYDAVDNAYFRENAEMLKTETLKSEDGGQKTEGGERKAESGHQSSVISRQFILPEKYFLASARFIEKKNLSRLIQAYARYRKLAQKSEVSTGLRPPASGLWPLVLLGDGELRPDLCRLISDLRLQDCVHLPGFIQYPELPAYYARAGAFIHASTTEQWGLVVNEAMASGLPVLVSNRCGCARDLVQAGVNGFTFDPYNVEQLAQLMLKISAMHPSSPPRPGRGIQGEVSNSTSDPSDSISLAREVQLLTSPGSMSEFQDVSLSAFGAASQRIISNWGPERFADGLTAAAERALKIGPKRAGIMDDLILRTLLS
jgi:1,2-diacylglycerol 3-alpha-glucosyltransferase